MSRRSFRGFVLAVLLLAAIAATGLARGQAEDIADPTGDIPQVGSFPVPLLVLFTHQGAELSAAEFAALRQSAVATLAARRPSARLLPEDVTHPAGSESADPRSLALERDAVGWLELSVVDDGSTTEIEIAGYAVAAPASIFHHSYREPPGLAGPRLRRAWDPAADAFDAGFEALVESALAEVRYTAVTVRAVPGTRIDGLGSAARVIPESGELQLQLRSPLVYAARARAPLHYPSERLILVLDDPLEVALDQPQRSAYSYELGLADFAYPTLKAMRRIGGDYLFARGGLTTYLLGIVPFIDDRERRLDDEEQLFISEPFSVLGLQLGSYLQPPHGRARLYLAAGGQWRVIHTRGYWGSDPVAPWGLTATLGVENRPSERWRLFLEWQPALYRTEYPEVLLDRLPGAVQLWGGKRDVEQDFAFSDDTAPAWILAGAAFRLGVRWQP